MQDFKRTNFKYLITYVLLFSLPLILMPEPVWVLTQKEEGEVLLKQGKQDYIEGRFEDAIEKLTLAIKLLADKDKLIDAYLHLGLCHFALGEKEKAKENLIGLIRLNPAQKLNPLYYPPDFVGLLDETKEVILAHIKVETAPADAEVYLDGELVGVAPLELTEVAEGEHKLRVVKEGYKAQEQSLVVKEGEEKTVSFELEKKEEKKPTVAVTPPEKKPEVKKGKGWLWILLGGAAAAVVAILATRGGKETPAPPPTQAFGSIQVKSYPNGATIFLDGQDTGFKTNHTLTNIPTGRHTILLRLAGWKDWEEEVTVYQNQTAVVKPCLLPPNGCFRDNFQDGDADGWEFFDSEWKINNEGGNYFLEGNSPGWDIHCHAKPQCRYIKNVSLRFRLKVVSFSDRGHFPVDFRYGSQGWYSFDFRYDRIVCDKHIIFPEECIDLRDTSRRIIIGKWHNIEIIAKGDNIQLFINNQLIINVNDHDERIEKGHFLFTASNGCHAQIDDVVITSNECP